MKAMSIEEALRAIPSVNEILEEEEAKSLIGGYGRKAVLEHVRITLDETKKLLRGKQDFIEKEHLHEPRDVKGFILRYLKRRIDREQLKGFKKLINATGIVLHTNLGRAPLPREAVEYMAEIAGGYCNLEFDLADGVRGSRHVHLEELLIRLTGAEAGMVVNNNAAAVFLCLNTFGKDREVIVSRGEQVEIGGSFRIPDIILRSGAGMIEIGTTNKTYPSDYEKAISEKTSILLKVHTSNYKVTGFTRETTLEELVHLGEKNNLITMVDLGSGCMLPLPFIDTTYEPTVQDCVATGTDLITFSGDKLLGGPQAGIIIGKNPLIEELKKNPLSRMLRCDKTTISALKKILEMYLEPEDAIWRIPVLSMLAMNEEQLLKKAESLLAELILELGSAVGLDICDVWDEAGGGSLPGTKLAGKAISFRPENIHVNELQSRLRQGDSPVICRIAQDKLYFHIRTIDETEFPLVCKALKKSLEDSV